MIALVKTSVLGILPKLKTAAPHIFQVHHSVVHGRCHLNVSAVMKKAPSDHNVRIVALRHDHEDDNGGGVAIENFSRFPEVIENNVRSNFSSPLGLRR